MVSYLGEGLNVVISCDHIPGHNWMSYLCWYSVRQNLPDSKISIICKRENVSGSLFLWTKKVNVPFRMYSGDSYHSILASYASPCLVVPPYCVAIRDFEEAGISTELLKEKEFTFLEDTKLVCDCNLDDYTIFSSYKKGWGHFITADWLNKIECPLSFSILKNFSKRSMSLSERKIEGLWNSSVRLFQTISGGVTQ